ncbi:MAG: HD domain-containing protein [Bacteroidota bacterium]
MPTLTLDVTIFSIFLALNLIVGLIYGRRVKTIHDYALGGKNFSSSTITATIIATWFGGGFLFYNLANIYSTGLYFIIPALGPVISLLITGQLLAVRMEEFLNKLSVAEAMGDLYGRVVRIIAALSGIFKSIGGVAIQFQVIGRIMTLILGIEGPEVIVLAASIVMVYSAFGGIRAVTFTDVVQFFTFGTFIPMLALIIWNNIKDPNKVVETLATNPIFDLKEVAGWNTKFISSIALMLYFAIPGTFPPTFQRISMARDVKQVKQSFTYASLIALLIIAFVAWVAILLLADNAELEASKLVNYIIDQYAYPGLKGLLAIGIVALAMSTADSYLNSSAVLFANDLAAPLGLTTTKLTFTARVFVLILGVLALLLALYETDLLSLMLLSGSFYMPIVSVPLLLAIFGFRSSKRPVLIGMAAGFATVVLWRNCFTYTGIDSVMPGTLASLIFLLGSHYLLRERGGWQKIGPTSLLAIERQERREAWRRRMKAIKNFKLYPYLQQNLPKQEYFYFFFGLYTIAATYAAFYTIGAAEAKAYQDIYEGICHTTLFATTAFLTFPIWPPTVKSQRFITFFWPVGICAILFFAGTLLVLMSHFHIMQVMILLVNLLVAVLLLRWPLALVLAATGVLAAVSFFKYYYPSPETVPTTLDMLQFKVIYGLLLLSSLLIALFKHKEANERLALKNASLLTTNQETTSELLAACRDRKKFAKAFRTSGAPALARLAGLSKEIVEETKDLNLPQELTPKIIQLHEQLSPIALHLDRLDHRAVGYLRLEVATITIDALLQATQKKLHVRELGKHINWKQRTQHKEVECDVARIESLLMNSISFIQNVAGQGVSILVGIEDTQLGYPMSLVKPGYTKKVAALRITFTTASMLPGLEKLYLAQMDQDTSPLPETIADLPLVANERILKAHYGYTSTMAMGKSLTQVYVIPVQLRAVRPQSMDLPEMELDAELIHTDDMYPGAQEQEAVFLKAVQERTQADLALIRKAIKLIKQYHGPMRRQSGEPFYLHPLAVAHIVLDYNQEAATVLGALLHDIVEDTSLTPDQLAILFNKEVRSIVDGVTHLDSHKDTFYKVKLSPYENIRMLLGVSDQRVLYVKIADRMHNMRTIQYKPYKSQRRTAEETLLFFVPLAEHLGLKEAAAEFKELCFKVLTEK